jgi:hypothetical protein
MTQFISLSRHSARGLRKIRKNLSQDSRCPDSYSKRAPPEYKNYSFGQLVLYFAAGVELYKTNSVALVRKRTMPTERPPLVGEVGDNFCG